MGQLVGWLGNVCFIAGAAAMARRRPLGYAVLNVAGNGAYVVQSYLASNGSLLALSLVLGAINLLTFYAWLGRPTPATTRKEDA